MKFLAVFVIFSAVCACDSNPSPYFSDGSDADTDTDTDADTDTDTDADTDTDTDTDTDSDTETDSDSETESDTETESEVDTDTSCESADECDEGQVCGMETQECFDIPDVGDNQILFCWDYEGSCDAFSGEGCVYWSPPTWNEEEGTPQCVATPSTCPAKYPTKACCLKNEGETNCLTQSFFLP
jgi:hypothetical protein